jgi:hypothetical protein
MIHGLPSIDRDEVVYRLLLAFSIVFTSLRAFVMIHHLAEQAANLIAKIAGMLGS